MSSYPCPVCGASTQVKDSRHNNAGGIRRRRQCMSDKCDKRFTTHEIELAKYHSFLKRLAGLSDQAAALIREHGAEREAP